MTPVDQLLFEGFLRSNVRETDSHFINFTVCCPSLGDRVPGCDPHNPVGSQRTREKFTKIVPDECLLLLGKQCNTEKGRIDGYNDMKVA